MALSAGTAFVTILADMGKFVSSVNSGLTKNQAALQKTGKSMTKYLTVPLLAAGAASVKLATDFEAQLAQIRGLAGQSADQVAAWGDQILELGPELGKTPQELAKALYFVASSGVDASKAMDVVTISAKASAAGLGETEVIADAVTSAMNAYAASNLTAAQASDVLVATVREGKGEADQMAPVLGSLLPLASELGIEFNEVGASLAVMTRVGDSAAIASTKINAIFSALLKVTPQAEKAFDNVGLSSDELRDSLGEKGLLPTLIDIRSAVGDNVDVLAEMFPNVRALRGILTLTGGDMVSTTEVFKNLANAAGATDDAFGEVALTADQKFKQAMAGLQAAGIKIGQDLLPIVESMVDWFKSLFGWLQHLSDGMRGFIETVGGIVAAIGPVLWILGKLSGAIKTMQTGFQSALTFLTNPWAIGIAAAALAIYGLYTAMNAGDAAAAKYQDALEAVSATLLDQNAKTSDATVIMQEYHNAIFKAAAAQMELQNSDWTAALETPIIHKLLQKNVKDFDDFMKRSEAAQTGMADFASVYNQDIAGALRNGEIDLSTAIQGWSSISDEFGHAMYAGEGLEERIAGVVGGLKDVNLAAVIDEFKRLDLVGQGWDHTLDSTIQNQAELGNVTRDDVIQALLDMGAPLEAATALADDWTTSIRTARVSAKRFANMTAADFTKWSQEVTTSFEDFIFGNTKMKEAFAITTKQLQSNLREQEAIAKRGAEAIKELTSIKNIDPAFQQWLLDQGPAYVDAFIGANEDGRKDMQSTWQDIEGYVGDAGKSIKDLPDADVKITGDSSGLTKEVDDAIDYLRGAGFALAANGDVTIAGTEQHTGGFAGTGPKRDIMNLASNELLSVLQAGEFVINKSVASQPGMRGFLEALNNGAQTFHQGGFADGPIGSGATAGSMLKGNSLASLATLAQLLNGAPTFSAPFSAAFPSQEELLQMAIANMGFAMGPVAAAWGGYSNGNIPTSAMVNIDGTHYLAPDAAAAFFAMQGAFGSLIRPITSAYRSYSSQVGVYAHNTPLGLPAAPPGQSMHGWGKALDLGAANALGWMYGNASKFNWHSGASFGDPAHFSYGITAKRGFRGVLQEDTMIQAHRGEFASIAPADEPMKIKGEFVIKDWKRGLAELQGELDWMDRSPRGRRRR